jgi:hypothetical protein
VNTDILIIKQTCISSRAFVLNGAHAKADEKANEANRLTFMLGNDLGFKAGKFIPLPADLKPFTTLNQAWESGVMNAMGSLDMIECTQCQDKNIAMCPYHDC